MPIRIVQLATPRIPGEGLRIGTVRRPPRGVPKSEFARRNFYDVWLPELSPSADLVAAAKHGEPSAAAWRKFEARYRFEMKQPDKDRLLTLLSALSRSTDFSVGCYCQNENRCHRSILRALLQEHGAVISKNP
jgi:uncharacterized protein YeaO (DUF488 family)